MKIFIPSAIRHLPSALFGLFNRVIGFESTSEIVGIKSI
jgi:hypothetical protein